MPDQPAPTGQRPAAAGGVPSTSPKAKARTQPTAALTPELTQADLDAGVTVEAVDHAAEVANVHLNTPDPTARVEEEKVTGPVLSGVDQALVRLKGGGTLLVNRGEAIPPDAEPEATDRLRSLGYVDQA